MLKCSMRNLFHQSLLSNFGFEPTSNQLKIIGELTDFVFFNIEKHLFVLKGYAGTGKTSLVGALVKTLPQFNFDSVLLAPTGRAAKVLANYSNKPAFTIHKMIYQLQSSGGFTQFVIKENKFMNTLFLVDEASMISDGGGLSSMKWGESKSLLDDLLSYVYAGKNCKLVLIGDTAQLPPVGMDISPALDIDLLHQSHFLNIEHHELTEVMRQGKDSEILANATFIRNKIVKENVSLPLFGKIKGIDVKLVSGTELEDVLSDVYGKYGEENTMGKSVV